MQLKFDHDYFNSYLKNLTNHSKISKCYEQCHEVQNPNHLMINCNHFRDQQAVLIKNMGLARSETSTRCRPGNGPLELANIWSRLLKHNWWDPLYERVRIHSDVFFDFTFNENSLLYDYINRASPEFQSMHVYDQQLCFLFHRCGPLFLFLNSWR